MDSLMQLVEGLKSIAQRVCSYSELLDRIAALPVIANRARHNTDINAVTLSTVHAAKGAEFNQVFIIDLLEGRFPAMAAVRQMDEGKKELLEEERRLFYVAITRACKHVELLYPARVYGERVKPSRFIRELLPLAPVRKVRPRNTSKQAEPGAAAKAYPEKKAIARKPAGIRPVIKNQTTFEQFNLEIGMNVVHKAFGHGVISVYDVKRDIVAVKFPQHGVKTFAAAFCMNGGVIKKPDENAEVAENTQ